MVSKSVEGKDAGQVAKATPRARFVSILEMEAQQDGRDTADFVNSLIDAMIDADTVEESIAAGNAAGRSGKELVNVPLRISWFSVVKSDAKYKSELGHYLLIEKCIRLDTREDCAFSVGSAAVIIPLWKARDKGQLPIDVIIRSADTSNGERLFLELLPKTAVPVVESEPAF